MKISLPRMLVVITAMQFAVSVVFLLYSLACCWAVNKLQAQLALLPAKDADVKFNGSVSDEHVLSATVFVGFTILFLFGIAQIWLVFKIISDERSKKHTA